VNTKKPSKRETNNDVPKRKSLFDHVKHIRQVQDPSYYENLSEDDRKSFNPFMILRALSMDASIVEDMAQLYQIFDKVPHPQLYQLLIAIVPRSNRFYPWIKTKKLKHKPELLELVSRRFQVPKYQANEYVNLLIRTEAGQHELIAICKALGLEDGEVDKLFEEGKEE
jgi:hypothetical protein